MKYFPNVLYSLVNDATDCVVKLMAGSEVVL